MRLLSGKIRNIVQIWFAEIFTQHASANMYDLLDRFLTLSMLWANSANNKLVIFFLIFPRKIRKKYHQFVKCQILVSMKKKVRQLFKNVFVCVEVLRPSQPDGVMSSEVSLPNHTFTGRA